MGRPGLFCVVVIVCSTLPSAARAQQNVETGGIQGTVTDTTGAAVAGSTVEVASPAMIEGTRTVTTDAQGGYRILALRPGTYSVTFGAAGFQKLQRTGIDLTSGFTATVNATLSVGATTQTVTVTEAAPVIDAKDSTVQQTVEGQILRQLPLSKNSGEYAMLLPGAVPAALTNIDVGGTQGETSNQVAIHGSLPNDQLTFSDGQYNHTMLGPIGSNGISSVDPTTIQEVNIQLPGGLTAEAMSPGIQINVIARDGGNQFHGTFLTDFKVAQSDNITEALTALGAGTTPQKLKTNYDFAGGAGGPILHDKLWFFVDARDWTSYNYIPGVYYNALQNTLTGSSGAPLLYQADLSRPAYTGTFTKSFGVRLTWQASQKDKFSYVHHYESSCNCIYNLSSGTVAPEGTYSAHYIPYDIDQVRWTHPVSDRLLIEAGVLATYGVYSNRTTGSTVTPNDISVLNLSTNLRYGAAISYATQTLLQMNTTGDVSYLTHSHALKFGYLYLHAGHNVLNQNLTSDSYTFIGNTPQSITYYAYPQLLETRLNQSALFAEDQWTIHKRLTVTPGLRFDHLNGYSPATSDPAGIYVPARVFPGAHNTPNWSDLNPRVGAAYDLFGDGKTVLKANIGRFDLYEGLSQTVTGADPANSQVVSATRTWSCTAPCNYVPTASELGPLSNAAFGQAVTVTHYDPHLLSGFDVRPYAWEASASVQRQLRTGLAVTAGYFRTWYGNFQVTKNLDVTPADYQSFCVNEPTNALLPGGGGQQICGMEDIIPSLFGHVDNFVTLAKNYGRESYFYNGFDFTVNAQIKGGGLITGGLSTAQTVTDDCPIAAAVPEAGGVTTIGVTSIGTATADPTRFCHVSPPWSAATQFKLSGVYPLPWWGLRVDGVWDYLPGAPTTALYNATCASNPEICTQLGRNLAAGANGVAAAQLIAPNTIYRNGSISLLNFTIEKSFVLSKFTVQPRLELYNVLNENGVEQINTTYGPNWQNITGLLPPRLLKIGLKVDW